MAILSRPLPTSCNFYTDSNRYTDTPYTQYTQVWSSSAAEGELRIYRYNEEIDQFDEVCSVEN